MFILFLLVTIFEKKVRFIKHIIQTKKTFTIVDIGTYKIRCNIIEIEKENVTILGYGEKKQEPWDFYFGEIKDIDNVSKNLQIAIKKAEKEADEKTKNIIFNSATYKVFFGKEKLLHTRTGEHPLKKNELKSILTNFLFSLKNNDKPIQSGIYWTKEMKLILWNIRKVCIDGKEKKNIMFERGINLEVTLNQFFMEMWKYQQLKKLASNVGKELDLVIPYENSVKDLVNSLTDSKDYVAINIWNTRTQIVIVRDNNIIATSYFNIWIGELIDTLSKKYKVTHIKAIKTIDSDNMYAFEKKEFYKIWEWALKISLEDMLGTSVCPHECYVFGGGYNKFIEHSLQYISFRQSVLKLEKKMTIKKILPERKDFIQGKFQLDVKSNFSLMAMIVSTKNYFKWSENEMVHILQKLIKKQ